MQVMRRHRQVLQAHRLPERLDQETRNFATKNQLAISELPNGGYSIFDLRWNISASHVVADAGHYIVMDDGVKALEPVDYLKAYEPVVRETV
jgi:hypothetical protein